MVDDISQQPVISKEKSDDVISVQNEPEKSSYEKRKWIKWLLVLLPILIVIIASLYFFNTSRQDKTLNNNAKVTTSSKKTIVEVATRTYFKNNQPSQVLKEESKKNPDGSLETIVTKDNKKLSHHLYFKNLIFKLSEGVLNLEKFKSTKSSFSYLTTGENILKFIKQTSDTPKTVISLNGKKTTVYTIGGKKTSSLQFIKAAFAQANDDDIVKVYVDEETGELKKIEQLPSNSTLPTEVIEYTEGPVLLPLPISSEENALNEPVTSSPIDEIEKDLTNLPNISVEEQLKMLEELVKLQEQSKNYTPPTGPVESTAIEIFQELRNETKEVKTITVDSPIIPNEAIYLNPLSTIPTTSGYNSPIMKLSSRIFNQQTIADKELKEKRVFESLKFTQTNVKVRIDGMEVSNPNMSLEPNVPSSSTNVPWTISLLIPKKLSPGYHTIEVYMINSWYLAPSLLIALPQPDEQVLEIDLFINPPPVAVAPPENQGYRVTLRGKNFIKPFTVSLDSTVLDDSAVQVNGTEELILTIPATIPPPSRGPAYDVVITKGSQKVFRPALLILGGPGSLP